VQEDARNVVQTIENYGSVGNIESVALIGMDGSIDFLCHPDFDSPTVLFAMLDDIRGGTLQIGMNLDRIRIRQPSWQTALSCDGLLIWKLMKLPTKEIEYPSLPFALTFPSTTLMHAAWRSSHLGHPSINVKLCARDVACIIGCEK
jgi:hypothetical protein